MICALSSGPIAALALVLATQGSKPRRSDPPCATRTDLKGGVLPSARSRIGLER